MSRKSPPDVCMVFDENGNALDAFDYTEGNLADRLRQLRGEPRVSMLPNPWATLSPARTLASGTDEGAA